MKTELLYIEDYTNFIKRHKKNIFMVKGEEGLYTDYPSWDEYLEKNKKYKEAILEIKELIIKNNLLGKASYDKINDNLLIDTVVFKRNGRYIMFTSRGWADLMQAIVNKRESYSKYC